jgi:diguanylate cyclase (GGDEF)-like protein
MAKQFNGFLVIIFKKGMKGKMGLFNLRKPNVAELKTKGQIDGLIQVLSYKKDANIRSQAAKALGEIGDKKATEALVEALSDSDASVRVEAVEAIGKIGSEKSAEAILKALNDEDWEVRGKAAEWLGKIGDERAIEPLVVALEDKHIEARLKAASALLNFGEKTVEPLIEALNNEDEEVRAEAASLLGELGNKKAIDSLVESLKDESWEVRRKAAQALKKLGEPAVEPLLDTLEDENETDWSSRVESFERVKELEKTAHIDTLTEVANRRLAEQNLEAKFNEMNRYGLHFGLLFIDIDHFKRVNDVYGHDAGDKVLQTVASILSSNIRASDIVGRWGGEEFVVIISNVNEEQLGQIAEKLRLLIQQSVIKVASQTIQVTISVGATVVKPTDDVETLVKRADQLMYKSKTTGRNRVSLG